METTRLIEATCPECRGPLSDVVEDRSVHEYRCLVGHRYSPTGLLEAHSETQEKTLWAAVVVLEEAANVVRAAADQFEPNVQERLRLQAEKKGRQAALIREILKELEPFATR
jgi:two-component system chemotaxis response regulator CheB